jgi:energy-coupling factor transporter ATP-binding protein EcfA2
MAQIDQFLKVLLEQGGSDLHLTVGAPPIIRVHGHMQRLKFRELTGKDMESLVSEIMEEEWRMRFLDNMDYDFAYEVPDLARFRANVFWQRKGLAAVMPTIPSKILTFADLNLPEVVQRFCMLAKGLVLVTGPTGSGKSTTLAAMVDWINDTRADHILTIEDPIEFTHPNKKFLVNQREILTNTKSFANALRAALREDPDVILVGEMRDRETIELGITAAETGHLSLWDAAHLVRPEDGRPYHRRVPGRPAGADPRDVGGVAQGRHRSGPVEDKGRQGSACSVGDHGGHQCHREPHPRKQDPPDSVHDPNGEEGWNAAPGLAHPRIPDVGGDYGGRGVHEVQQQVCVQAVSQQASLRRIRLIP